MERLAILPANVLVSDTSSQWLKIGVPLMLQQDLMTAHDLVPGVAMNESAALQEKATQVLRTTVESRQGGLHIESSLVDLKTQKNLQVRNADAASVNDVIAATNALAKKLDSNAGSYPTNNLNAMQSYLGAAGSSDRQRRGHFLQQAIGQDPNFGMAYIALAEMLGPKSLNLTQFVTQAKSHSGNFSAYDRAKFNLAVSRLMSAAASQQIQQAQEGLKLAPNDLDLLTVLGINQFVDGDGKAGEDTLRRAIDLSPGNPNFQLQLGRGLMQERKLKEADTVLSSVQNNPAVLPDLATCVLLEGDAARANAIAEKIFSTVQSEALKPLFRASWLVIAGQREKGIAMLLNTKFDNPPLENIALSEAAVWQVMGKDYAGAKSSLARTTAVAGQTVSFPAVAGFLVDQEGSAPDWRKKVDAAGLPPDVKMPLLAYGYFLRGSYDDAAVQWRQILDQSHGNDLRARAMLASSLDRAGKKGDAAQVKVMPFAPEFGDLYAAIPFAEMRRVLGI